jgi:hypothetical protein
VSELYGLSDRRFLAKLVSTFADKGCRVVSAPVPHGFILGFLYRKNESLWHFIGYGRDIFECSALEAYLPKNLTTPELNCRQQTQQLWTRMALSLQNRL